MLYDIKFIEAFNTLEEAKTFCQNCDYSLKVVYVIRTTDFEDQYAVDTIEFESKPDIDYLIDTAEYLMFENDCYHYYYMYFGRLNVFGNITMCCIVLDESY